MTLFPTLRGLGRRWHRVLIELLQQRSNPVEQRVSAQECGCRIVERCIGRTALLAGFRIALQVEECFASDQEAGSTLLDTAGVLQVGASEIHEGWVILQVLIAQRGTLEQARLVGRCGSLLIGLLPCLCRCGMIRQAGLSLGQHFKQWQASHSGDPAGERLAR